MKGKALGLLRIDALAGLSVGLTVLLLVKPLSQLYGLPEPELRGLALANLAYGSYSGSLVIRLSRGRALSLFSVRFLALANALWAPICLAIVVAFWPRLQPLGVTVLLFEAVFVGGLGVLEWRILPLLANKR